MTRPYQRNVKTGTSIYQLPTLAFHNDSTDHSCPRRPSNCIQRLDRSQHTSIKHLAVSPRLDLCQLPSSNVLLCTTTTRPYQLTTLPILAEDRIQPPQTFTYTFVILAIKSSLLLYLLSCLLSSSIVFGHAHSPALNSFAESTRLSAPQQYYTNTMKWNIQFIAKKFHISHSNFFNSITF